MKDESTIWSSGDPYEYFMGRWSRKMALVFLEWLNMPFNLSWLDVGCGTGALSEAILKNYQPSYLGCVDNSPEFLNKARENLSGKGDFHIARAEAIPLPDNSCNVVVSGLALNFFPELLLALSEMKRVVANTGIIAAYVWDYAGRMDFLRLFWDAVGKIDSNSKKFDEGIRFPICNSEKLFDAFLKTGIENIETSYLTIDAVFENFDDFWNPFLGGQGPAPSYLISQPVTIQNQIKSEIQKNITFQSDGTIKLMTRAVAIRGRCQ